MTLSEFLIALTNSQMLVTILDSDNTELIKTYAPGYAQLVSSLLARTVDKITIVNNQAATIKLTETT